METLDQAEVQLWLPYRKIQDDGCVLRLWAFHWFGASASAFGFWPKNLDSNIDFCAVQLPGREGRLGEEKYRSARQVAADLVRSLRPMFEEEGCSTALFGHSSGSWLAFEVARQLRREGLPAPVLLLVSNFPAPQTPTELLPWRASSDLIDNDFRQEVAAWGLPPSLFDSNTWKLFEPQLRHDFAIFDTYEYEEEEPLPCPIGVYISQDDPKVGPSGGNPELMEHWSAESSHLHMTVDVFRGNHFYLQDSAIHDIVAATVAKRTSELADLLSFDF